MDPNLNSDNENPYDFIFKDDNQVATAKQPFGSKNRQLLIFGGFVVVVLLVVGVVVSLIASSGNPSGTEIVSVSAYQIEIDRVMEIGNKNVRSAELKKKLATIDLVLANDSAQVTSIVERNKIVATGIQLAQHQDSTSDTAIVNSLQSDDHDVVYEQIIDNLVAEYFASINAAQTAVSSKRDKETLSQVKTNVATIYDPGESSSEAESDPESKPETDEIQSAQ